MTNDHIVNAQEKIDAFRHSVRIEKELSERLAKVKAEVDDAQSVAITALRACQEEISTEECEKIIALTIGGFRVILKDDLVKEIK